MALVTLNGEDYYHDFEQQALRTVEAAEALRVLATHFDQPDELRATVQRIRSLEHAGDALTRDLFTRIERSSLPYPRDELRALIGALDDQLDSVDNAVEAFETYAIERLTAPAVELIELATQCVATVCEAVRVLRALPRRKARLAALRPLLEEVNRLENLSDTVYRDAMSALFRQDDVALMLRWKPVYDYLAAITDRCDDVGDALQTVTLRRM